MARVYIIRVYRPERGEIDHVSIRAIDRRDAEEFAQLMYPSGTIVRKLPSNAGEGEV